MTLIQAPDVFQDCRTKMRVAAGESNNVDVMVGFRQETALYFTSVTGKYDFRLRETMANNRRRNFFSRRVPTESLSSLVG